MPFPTPNVGRREEVRVIGALRSPIILAVCARGALPRINISKNGNKKSPKTAFWAFHVVLQSIVLPFTRGYSLKKVKAHHSGQEPTGQVHLYNV